MVAEAVLRQEGDEASAAAGSSSSSSSGAGTSSSSSTVSQSQDGYDCKLQLKAYALVDVTTKEDCVPVMVSITAEHAPPRAAVDVVLALHVDIRCTAPANWHDLLKDATKVVVDRLGHDDRLATVPSFQEETIRPPPANWHDLLKDATKVVVDRLGHDDRLATVPSFQEETIRPPKPNALIDRHFEGTITVPLEPKFLPASQAKNALQLVAGSQAMRGSITMGSVLETAVSVLSARGSDEKKQRAGYIIIISNSNDKSISSQLTWKLQCVHAFGFCDAHNSNAMRAITGNRDSTCGVLDEGGEITNGFVGTIDNITSSAAVEPVEVKIECSEKVLLSSIDAPRINHLISYDKKMGLVWRNVRADTATNFMVYVMIPGNDHNRNALLSSLLSFEVKHRSGGAPQKFEKVIVGVMKGTEVSKQMVAEMRRWEAVRIVAKYCKGDGECEELHAAADDLRLSWISCYKEEAHGHLISHLDAQIRDMEIRLHNNYMWLEYMHSWLSHQWWKLPLKLKFMKKQRLQEDTTIDEPDLVQRRILLLANVDDIPNKIRKPGLLPVLIRIKAPMSGLAKKKRAPIDMVAVLDITGEVNDETKMNLLQAMDHIMMRLSHYDKLALILIPVPSQHAAATVRLSPMDKKMRGAYTKLLSSIVMPHQLNKKATGCLPIATKTASATNTNTIPTLPESLAHAYKILDERPPDDKNRLGIVIVISDRNDDLNTSAMALSFNYSVHAFGFRGLDRNARMMHHIASKSNGIYAIIEDGGQITNDFKDCINKITSIIVEDVKVDINIRCTSKSWRLHTIESGHFRSSISHDSKSGSILAGALYAGAEKRFLVYVGNDVHEDDYHNLSKVFTVDIMHPSMLPSSNTEKKRPQDGQDATFKSAEVVKEIVRVEEVKIARAFAATYGDPNIVLGQLEELHWRLREPDKAQTDTDDVRLRPEGLAKAAAINIVSITSIMTEELEESSRLSYMLSWLSFQELTEQPLPMALRKRHRRRTWDETSELSSSGFSSPRHNEDGDD